MDNTVWGWLNEIILKIEVLLKFVVYFMLWRAFWPPTLYSMLGHREWIVITRMIWSWKRFQIIINFKTWDIAYSLTPRHRWRKRPLSTDPRSSTNPPRHLSWQPSSAASSLPDLECCTDPPGSDRSGAAWERWCHARNISNCIRRSSDPDPSSNVDSERRTIGRCRRAEQTTDTMSSVYCCSDVNLLWNTTE